jgi:hypothetical protein
MLSQKREIINVDNYFEIFPTAIGKYKYIDHATVKEIILDIMANTQEVRRSKDANHYFEHTGSFLDMPVLSNFKEFLEDSANDYTNNLLKLDSKMFITLSWINQTHSTCVMSKHNHGNSFFSGTYYLNFNAEIHEPLMFTKELEFSAQTPYMGIIPHEYNNFNAPGYRLTNLEEGDFVIWPAHLLHGHGPNKGNNRISISMNFLPTHITNGIYKFKITK